jgi:hypothetical protein
LVSIRIASPGAGGASTKPTAGSREAVRVNLVTLFEAVVERLLAKVAFNYMAGLRC